MKGRSSLETILSYYILFPSSYNFDLLPKIIL
jgi:hypothetical protein